MTENERQKSKADEKIERKKKKKPTVIPHPNPNINEPPSPILSPSHFLLCYNGHVIPSTNETI